MLASLPPLNQVLNLLPDAVCVVDAGGVLQFANTIFERLLGLAPGEMIGRNLFELIHPEDRPVTSRQALALMQGTGDRHFHNRYMHKNGHAVELLWAAHWLPEYGVRIGVAREIGDLRRIERELKHHAHHDPLTGLANRRRLEQSLMLALQQACDKGGEVALLYLDLDGFKQVNDHGGHEAGDRVLRNVAEHLQLGLRQIDLVARMGGDEFVVLLPGCGREHALNVAVTLRENLRNGNLPLTASIGIACFPVDACTPQALLAHADAAMYASRRKCDTVCA